MYVDIPVWLAIAFLIGGLVLLAWSADKFTDGAAGIARLFGVSPFVVGMVVIGFGTSAPELCVSALSGLSGHSDLSLGNAYGSCIFNIAFILGVSALIRPMKVKPSVTFVAAPVLVAISVFSTWLVADKTGFTRSDGLWQLGVFGILLPLYCWFDAKSGDKQPKTAPVLLSCGKAIFEALVGLLVLVGSSHLLVWGAVDVARSFGVSELMIGLTVVAIGTSLPELASAIASARKGEDDFVIGNIVGSNFFNTLAVVGVAGTISPFKNVSPYLLSRDLPVLIALSLSIAAFGINWRKPRENGQVNRLEGVFWILLFVVYSVVMVKQEVALVGG